MTPNPFQLLMTEGSGMLGRACRRLRPDALVPPSSEFDVTNYTQMETWVRGRTIGAVLHAAAFTSPPRVDQNASRALDVNIVGTANVVRLCLALGVRLVYIST